MNQVDIIMGAVYGDEAKSKVTHHMLKEKDYDLCLRYNGGENAGHTFYIEGQKVITHAVPTGVFSNVLSVVGPGCVINESNFLKEVEELSKIKPDIEKYLRIAKNTHIVLDEHIEEDKKDSKIGTTKKGIGPAYRSKFGRTGLRAENVHSLKPFLVDMYDVLYSKSQNILCEGAQALGLDVDWGDYPYVTSSNCGVGAVVNNGICYQDIRDVIGVAKVYDTYVGNKIFQTPGDKALEAFAEVGEEYGATTGRLRQTNYLNLDWILKALHMSGFTQIIFNKLDIIREVGVWKVIYNGSVIDLENETKFLHFIVSTCNSTGLKPKVIFSESPFEV